MAEYFIVIYNDDKDRTLPLIKNIRYRAIGNIYYCVVALLTPEDITMIKLMAPDTHIEPYQSEY